MQYSMSLSSATSATDPPFGFSDVSAFFALRDRAMIRHKAPTSKVKPVAVKEKGFGRVNHHPTVLVLSVAVATTQTCQLLCNSQRHQPPSSKTVAIASTPVPPACTLSIETISDALTKTLRLFRGVCSRTTDFLETFCYFLTLGKSGRWELARLEPRPIEHFAPIHPTFGEQYRCRW